MAGVGGEEDKALRKEAAQHEKAWAGAGLAAGLQVWRIEQFQVVPWPKAEYGTFFEGDAYIVLRTKQKKDGQLARDIFFWLGEECTQDEAGTAAYKTVELDAYFDEFDAAKSGLLRNGWQQSAAPWGHPSASRRLPGLVAGGGPLAAFWGPRLHLGASTLQPLLTSLGRCGPCSEARCGAPVLIAAPLCGCRAPGGGRHGRRPLCRRAG